MCIEENQQPFGGVVADKNVQAHDPQKKSLQKMPLSAKKSFAIDGSRRILLLLWITYVLSFMLFLTVVKCKCKGCIMYVIKKWV